MVVWNKNSSMPRAIQDCAVTVVKDHLMVVGGYCSGPLAGAVMSAIKYKKFYRGKRPKYIRGFTNLVHCIHLGGSKNKWFKLPHFPGGARASMAITTINNQVFCWGGYSFIPSRKAQKMPVNKRPPKDGCVCYKDGYVLDFKEKKWTKLPDLPYELTNFNLVNDGRWIYLLTGAMIQGKTKSPNCKEIANRCWKIDSRNLQNGWSLLATCPGTLRMDASVTYHKDHLYVLGGVYPNEKWTYQKKASERFHSVLDNWKYNVKTNKWTELVRSPQLIGNWASNNMTVYANRYIYLIGGSYYYLNTYKGNVVEKNPKVLKNKGNKPGEYEFTISEEIYRYDIENNKIDLVCKLPFPLNKPRWQIFKNQIHLVGGEVCPAAGKYQPYGSSKMVEGHMFQGEFFGYHCDLYAVGDLPTV